MPPTVSANDLAHAADRLVHAQRTRTPCPPVRDLIGSTDVGAAYAVQQAVQHRTRPGDRPVGRKIGLTSTAVQRQLGIDRPDFGVLYEDMQVADGRPIPPDRLLQPKVEAEIAFVLGTDLDHDDLDRDHLAAAHVRAAVQWVVGPLEIVDSRIAGWDITFGDTVADNASSGMFVLGTRWLPLSEVEPAEVTMTMSLDGEEVSTGTGAACLGDPLTALLWLARTARDLGDPLRAGQIVLSGALGPMVALPRGSVARAEIGPLGSVTANHTPHPLGGPR